MCEHNLEIQAVWLYIVFPTRFSSIHLDMRILFLYSPFAFLLALYFKGTPLLYLNNVYTLCTL